MGKRGLIGEHAQMFEKGGKAAGKQADFEDRGKRGGFEKKRNRLTQIVPEVGAFGFVESDELGEFCVRDSSHTSKFARGALADFGIAFHADAKMARIGGKFPLERRGGNFGRIVFSFELTRSTEAGRRGERSTRLMKASASPGVRKERTKPRLAGAAGKVRKLRRVMTASVPREPIRSL